METVRVSSKGQIVIPKELRTAFHIEPGSELAIFAEGDEIHLRQAEQRFARTDVVAGLGLLAKPGRKAPASEAALCRAVQWFEQGLDFADALHLGLSPATATLATFDKEFVTKARRIEAFPAVVLCS